MKKSGSCIAEEYKNWNNPMPIENIPEIFIGKGQDNPDLFVYDFKMTQDVVKSKVNLGMNMFSFLQVGKKQVHFAGTAVAVNKDQSLLLKKGNWLWTELLDKEAIYFCKLFFFSEKKLREFIEMHIDHTPTEKLETPYFIIRNDEYITSYLNSLSTISEAPTVFMKNLLSVKFEELMLYLLQKYGRKFELYLHSLIIEENSPFKKIVESKIHSNLKLEEIAFLCHMSLSTFKRHFVKEYKVSPGKWLQDKRLLKAKEILELGHLKPSDIYTDFGYNNLSNFSIAYKNKFGFSPNKTNI